jgi:hypothetical protein
MTPVQTAVRDGAVTCRVEVIDEGLGGRLMAAAVIRMRAAPAAPR